MRAEEVRNSIFGQIKLCVVLGSFRGIKYGKILETLHSRGQTVTNLGENMPNFKFLTKILGICDIDGVFG